MIAKDVGPQETRGEIVMNPRPVKRWPQLLTGSLVFMCIGIVYAWSMFAGTFKTNFSSWTNKDLGLTFTLIMGFFCLGNFYAGVLGKQLSPKAVFILSAVLNGLGYLGVALVQANTLWLLYLSYGVVGSFGVGLAYNTVLSTVTRWFPDRIGAVSGTLMMSFACSTLVVGVAADALCHWMSWRYVFVGVGALSALALLMAAFILKQPGPGLLPQKPASGKQAVPATQDLTTLEMVRNSAFWLFFTWGILLLVAVYGLMGNVKQCVLDLDPGAKALATASVTLLAISNGLGRLLLGSLYDKLGRRWTMTLGTALIILSSVFMVAAFKTHLTSLMLLGVALTGFAYGGVPPTSSAFIADYFGVGNYSMKFGVINLFIFIGAFGSTLAGMIKDSAGSFENLFYLLIVMGVFAMGLNLLIRKPVATATRILSLD
jgi:MFS transporter, OFA family, oxalate/formate antiporter